MYYSTFDFSHFLTYSMKLYETDDGIYRQGKVVGLGL